MISPRRSIQKKLNLWDGFIVEEMPKVVVDYVTSLTGEVEKRVVRVGDGSIINLFDRTPDHISRLTPGGLNNRGT